MSSILITGGCGYIGTHLTEMMKNYNIVIYDDLKNGTTFMNKNKIYRGDISDRKKLNFLFDKYNFDTIIHLAGLSHVSESVENPKKYYDNNIRSSLDFLDLVTKKNIKNFIFSSSCTVYGDKEFSDQLISENDNLNPTNPYGNTKMIFEIILQDYAKKYNFNYGILRYFNACGSFPDLEIGEYHEVEKRIIPILIKCFLGKTEFIDIYGDDFKTIDGTPVRDYTHVCDIADAHIKTLEYIKNTRKNLICNIGSGVGYSIKQLIVLLENITGKKIIYNIKKRRPGETGYMISSNKLAKKILNWEPKYNIDDILKSSYIWYNIKLTKIEKELRFLSYFSIDEVINSDTYRGYIKKNKYDEYGKLIFSDGGIFEGNFIEGILNLECGEKIKILNE